MISIKTRYRPKKLLFNWSLSLDYDKQISITFDDGDLIYRNGLGFDRKIISPSTDDWISFWLKLDIMGIWSWKSKYVKKDALNHYHWNLNIASKYKEMKSSGRNLQPEHFNSLIKAFDELLKQEIQLDDIHVKK